MLLTLDRADFGVFSEYDVYGLRIMTLGMFLGKLRCDDCSS
ncbi:MAG TPA: hypothetical protein PKD72_05975 [Gemmatales bacterium]|nr:hypothetical protein [Gemmatales bacterium]